MDTFNCKCVSEYKSFMISDEKKEKGGPFTFIVDMVYVCVIIKNDYWGDCYSVTDYNTGFVMGFNREDFDKYFYLLA